jgi:hypothetical protein
MTHIAAGIFGLVLAYASGLTMLVNEAVRALIDTGKEAAKEAGAIEQSVQKDVGGIAGAVEGEVKKLEHR